MVLLVFRGLLGSLNAASTIPRRAQVTRWRRWRLTCRRCSRRSCVRCQRLWSSWTRRCRCWWVLCVCVLCIWAPWGLLGGGGMCTPQAPGRAMAERRVLWPGLAVQACGGGAGRSLSPIQACTARQRCSTRLCPGARHSRAIPLLSLRCRPAQPAQATAPASLCPGAQRRAWPPPA